jgi:hypothetical protein
VGRGSSCTTRMSAPLQRARRAPDQMTRAGPGLESLSSSRDGANGVATRGAGPKRGARPACCPMIDPRGPDDRKIASLSLSHASVVKRG